MKNQLKNPNFYFMLSGDALLIAAALTCAYLFRFEFSMDAFYVRQLKQMLIFVIPLKLCTFYLFDLYKGMWRYTSTRDFWRLLQASFTSTLIILAFIFVFYRFEGGYSRAVFVMDGGLTFLLTGGLRMVDQDPLSEKRPERTDGLPSDRPAQAHSHRRRRGCRREDFAGNHRKRSTCLIPSSVLSMTTEKNSAGRFTAFPFWDR